MTCWFAWTAEPPCLNFGRFDLGYDGIGPPKLFEFNCDTPTSLLEAAVIQWAWKEQVFPDADQFNSLHDKLVAKWKDIAPFLSHEAPVHFSHAHESTGEEAVTTAYLMDTAREAGEGEEGGGQRSGDRASALGPPWTLSPPPAPAFSPPESTRTMWPSYPMTRSADEAGAATASAGDSGA